VFDLRCQISIIGVGSTRIGGLYMSSPSFSASAAAKRVA
jgi:hypothetical protein